jgi:hypothetical protein
MPIQDVAVADLNNDAWQELVVLEGSDSSGDFAETVAIWQWHGWGFQLEWRSQPGRWRGLATQDLNGDNFPKEISEQSIR